MTPARDPLKIPRWVWFALAATLAGIPIAVSVSVPTTTTGAGGSVPAPTPIRSAETAGLTPAPMAPDGSPAPSPGGEARAAPDPGAPTPGSPSDAEKDALESEMATLKIEKGAIEAEEARLRGKREELEGFERDHPNGAPPELYSRYEDARATYNSDVQAFKSRVGAYEMKVAEIERRSEALQPAAP